MKSTTHQSLDTLCINTIRTLSIDAIQKADSGHPGLPLGAAPMAYVLWTRYLQHNPVNPHWYNRDRFVLSAGHGSILLYSLLHLTGYAVSLEQIKQFRQWGSITPGHPESHITPGIDVTTGPLGQGFANGVGMAIGEAYLSARYNRPGFDLINHFTYALVSDGDLMEGVAAEAASIAGHLKLGKLIYLYDDNHITLSGSTQLIFTENTQLRFESYGWHTLIIEDGNDVEAIDKAIKIAQGETQRPSLLIIKTHIGYGSPHKQDTFEAHGSPLGVEEVKLTKQHLGWPIEPPFYIPEKAKKHFGKAVAEGQALEKKWNAILASYAKKHPKLAEELHLLMNKQLPKQWNENIPTFEANKKGMATRDASAKVMQAFNPNLPGFIGGSADLNSSTKTTLVNYGNFQNPSMAVGDLQGSVGGSWNYGDRNLFYGVREHAMGSISNGLATFSGIIPFTATFLVFSDYMRPAIRLAALTSTQVIFVFTHDSIGLGEDGPTHQAVEQLASLRAIPNLIVLRPADANETAIAWQVAIETRDKPSVLVFTRQAVPTLDSKIFASAKGVRRGAYILSEAANGKPELILMGSGSEVHLLIEAQQKLQKQNIAVRVVSMPSWELFEQQSKKYRDSIFPAEVRLRLAVEAGVGQGWERYTGEHGAMISIERFGTSAPGEVVMEKYGFSVKNVCRLALKLLKNVKND